MESRSRYISKVNEYVGTGIPSFDAIIGGGYSVGSLVVIREDELGSYSDLYLKVFIAQGVVNQDNIIVASNDDDSQKIVCKLPEGGDSKTSDVDLAQPSGSMQIAWRYETSYKPRVDVSKHRALSVNFYFKSSSKQQTVPKNVTLWPNIGGNGFLNLEECILRSLSDNNHFNHCNKGDIKNVTRVAVPHLGSVFWNEDQADIPKFLYRLRCISHHSRAVFLVTLPKHILKEETLKKCQQVSDVVIDLESLDSNANPIFNEYNGLIKFLKVSPVNSLATNLTEGEDWAFKLLKKKLFIERLTLPPELSSSTQREQDTLSCSSFSKSIQF